ncbi:DUF4304 domain-containing protein [Microbulbifer sp. 2201CG32-9]|uniref:DUF4304 domain-containing protein n=1 Tax=Microbulbifer sp. 2201CG32-9 TaxID=3232309 RepID=UPI00345BDF21
MKTDHGDLRKLLIEELASRLLEPWLKKGFGLVSLGSDEKGAELETAFPLGRLKKDRNGDIEIIEVQFDKYGAARFVINFGIVPKEGVELPWGQHLDRHQADASALPEAYRLYRRPFLDGWFGLNFFSPKGRDAVKSIVDTAIGISSEMEEWFRSKAVGRHMKRFGMHGG